MKPNNVTRMLDSRGIHYTAFETVAEKLGALETARILGVPPEQVFKTIVVTREGKGKPILAVVPGDGEVDLKAVAREVNEKKVSLPTEREAERITGLQAGGISPLALLNRGFEVILDETALYFDEIHISGGQRGLNIRLAPDNLIALTQAKTGQISR
ncbi:MAG: aminoacyl-tRNA deacylase [Chloroflexota bacterium]|nr:MAG: aminoacyl-tRNA deacylase [Chloroflexota bacterium]